MTPPPHDTPVPIRSSGLVFVPDMATLEASTQSAGDVVMLLGYHIPGDGGGGFFVWHQVSPSDHDGGTFVHVEENEGWKRLYDGVLNVKWFGAKGDGETKDSTAVQSALDALAKGQMLYFPKGIYLLRHGLHCNKIRVTLSSSGAVLRGEGDIGAVLNLTGTSLSTVDGLKIEGAEFDNHVPKAGIVLGRKTSSRIGNWITFRNVDIRGSFERASLYNACAENFTATACYLKNENGSGHAYYDTVSDPEGLTAVADLKRRSNSTKRFYGCGFYLASNSLGRNSNMSTVVNLDGTKNISFKDCYFSFLGGTGFVFGAYNATTRVTLEDIRVELNPKTKAVVRKKVGYMKKPEPLPNRKSRLIFIDNVKRTLSGLMLRGLGWHVRGVEALVEVGKMGRGIEHSMLMFPEPGKNPYFKSCIVMQDAAEGKKNLLKHCQLTVPTSSSIEVASSGKAINNVVFVMDGENDPFFGPGDYSDNKVIPATSEES